jgi:hypothetical protein
MPSFTVKVPNGDEGEDLGAFESDYLPRVGDSFMLFHPRLTGESNHPFEGVVTAVWWEAYGKDHKYASDDSKSVATATVWLAEEGGAVTIYCDCSPQQRERFGIGDDNDCENCGHTRP